ncbi:MAG: fused MFS/spermidine synthase [Pseudomonadota bacterium]
MDVRPPAVEPSLRAIRWLYVVTILSGSFLLFLVQPMVARMALPRLGGAPAVWNSAMLVYQALLLGGYGYAHALGRVAPRAQAAIHLAVLALGALWLPIGVMALVLPAAAEPALWVPWLLVASIGPLFFAISAQAPLVQRWYAVATGGRDPYALYAASNIGSFGGLIVYPLLVEPLLTLRAQSWLWSAGYALVLVMMGGCALLLPRRAAHEPHVRHFSAAPGWRRVGTWVLLSFVPSGLMLATSTFLTTDIVAVPMLWVMPLGLYLLSFSVAFAARRGPAEVATRAAPVMLILFGATLINGSAQLAYLNAVIGLLLLFVVAVALHTRLYALRPEPDRLTGFYLAMALGGALGGVFAALIAPVVFDWTYEYPLLIVAAGALMPREFLLRSLRRFWSRARAIGRIRRLAAALVVLLIVLAGAIDPLRLGDAGVIAAFLMVAIIGLAAVGARLPYTVALIGGLMLFGGYRALQLSYHDARTRSYFGVYTVSDYPAERRLAHGTTLHGIQLKGAASTRATTYYVPGSGVGQAMQALPPLYGPHARIGVVGLGTGTLACYALAGQQWRFFEIDPAVVTLARDSGKFTFLSQCAPDATITLGDARLSLGALPDNSLDLLVLDAFSSDAVPMHLMTREAFATYGRVLAPRGLLLVHISNRFLALGPVVSSAATAGGWRAARRMYVPTAEEQAVEASASDWIALSRDAAVLAEVTRREKGWRPLATYPGFTPWTDDFASIMPVLRALHPHLATD